MNDIRQYFGTAPPKDIPDHHKTHIPRPKRETCGHSYTDDTTVMKQRVSVEIARCMDLSTKAREHLLGRLLKRKKPGDDACAPSLRTWEDARRALHGVVAKQYTQFTWCRLILDAQDLMEWLRPRVPKWSLYRKMVTHLEWFRTQKIDSCRQLLFYPVTTVETASLRDTIWWKGPVRHCLEPNEARALWMHLGHPEPTVDDGFLALFLYHMSVCRVTTLDACKRDIMRKPYQTLEKFSQWSVYTKYNPYRFVQWFRRHNPYQDPVLPVECMDDGRLYLTAWYHIEQDILDVVRASRPSRNEDGTKDEEKKTVAASCVICLEDMTDTMCTQRLDCRHTFHRTCLAQWLADHETCPICRALAWTHDSASPEFAAWLAQSSHSLNRQQQHAAQYALQNYLTFVVGAAGTGKTQVASVLGEFMARSDTSRFMHSCVFVTPTGKAAENLQTRMRGGTCSVTTIHSWINNMRESSRPIPILFVDEAGMVNLWTTWHILTLAKRCNVQHLVFFGDRHQLPPVTNDGTLLDALVSLQKRPGSSCDCVHELTQNYRSSTGLLSILKHLRDIADTPGRTLQPSRLQTDESELVVVQTHTELFRTIGRAVHQQTDGATILVDTKRPLLQFSSTIPDWDAQLTSLYDALNPRNRMGHRTWYRGDIVMCTVNARTKSYVDRHGVYHPSRLIVANGSRGRVVRRDPLTIRFDNGCTLAEDANDDIQDEDVSERVFATAGHLVHGTIVTTHKFQGSEDQYIIVAFGSTCVPFSTIQLLYTAASRAKKKLLFIFMEETLKHYTEHTSRVCRNGAFNERVRSCYEHRER